jgi:hypothetical protein
MISTLFILALASFATATPLKRTPGLVVSLSTPQASIESVHDISLTATVENTVRTLGISALFSA